MVTLPLKRLQNAILFYFFQRKAPGPWCVLPQGRAQSTNFSLSIVQQFSFCFFIQTDSLVRFAVWPEIHWWASSISPPSPILNRKQRHVVYFKLFITFPGVKAENELDFCFNHQPPGKPFWCVWSQFRTQWVLLTISFNSQADGRVPSLCAAPLFQQHKDLLPWGYVFISWSPKGTISQPLGEKGNLILFKQTLWNNSPDKNIRTL